MPKWELEGVVLTPDEWRAINRTLEFYANEANWRQSVAAMDAGEQARNVLGMVQEEANGHNGAR